jgi:hypothetical protein
MKMLGYRINDEINDEIHKEIIIKRYIDLSDAFYLITYNKKQDPDQHQIRTNNTLQIIFDIDLFKLDNYSSLLYEFGVSFAKEKSNELLDEFFISEGFKKCISVTGVPSIAIYTKTIYNFHIYVTVDYIKYANFMILQSL